VDKRLSWFLHAPAFFFQEKARFPYHHTRDACAHLAVLGIGLLQRASYEEASACGDSIRAIAHNCARAETPQSYTSEFGFADCVVNLELLARAADALGQPSVAAAFRVGAARPEDITEEKWPGYAEALATRTSQIEEELHERGRDYVMRPDPVAELRKIPRSGRPRQDH
jgi:hypothetical protein